MQTQPLSKWIAIGVLLSFLSGCGVLAVGGVAATASVMADRRSPGVQAIDKGLEIEADSALSKRFDSSAHINVNSFNQKVLLTGEVKNDEIKNQAAEYVKSLKNVRSVLNQLIIGPNSSYAARANDSYLDSKVKTQMIFTEKLPSNSMDIVVEADNVYMLGILTQSEADLAKKVASNTNGVKEVFAFFDIISDAEKARLEKLGKAEETQPTSPSKFQ
ncbi:BON domain-containing protein [Polynucleobacter paneuropaeus]|jgi:osmotically-inducible protein OsmY|nr:BON domain-containing protein [Polynucleobacter paneuropaeus]MBT8541879.1 BON domain-containing protein [Polynucleobacter paneuropaeus]MBT8549104.1 BON domain-containing protein [Polynucleobacter paneuropaeus]MBT8571360.1 BON domain-containing protein [Polynucleobacter paneuropaeus]MBT8581794.1 BON domain-containing protein [Polynucleobacter paneuropaeus]